MFRRAHAAWFGARKAKSPSARSRRRPISLERLEGRELLAVDFTSALGIGGPDMGVTAVAQDVAGNSFVAGYFDGTTNFAPAGAPASNLTSSGYYDVFVARYNADG